MLAWWTIGRASAFGLGFGFCALVLWPVYAAYQEVFWAYAAALAGAALCGLSILLITFIDIVFRRRRGRRLQPVRAFDIALGTLLALPSLVQLEQMLPA